MVIISWLKDNYIEVLGTIAGLLYLYLSVKQNIWLWVLGFISSVVYVYVYYHSKFYADMSLQFYYIVVSVYGWFSWRGQGTSQGKKEIPVRIASLKEWSLFLVASVFLSLVLGLILQRYTDSPIPYWDGFTTGASIVATWMLTKKYIENWLFWVVIDFVSLILYAYKGLYSTVVLFTVYTVVAVLGYLEWKKSSGISTTQMENNLA